MIVSIKEVSPLDYLGYRRYDPMVLPILKRIREVVDPYVPKAIETNLSSRAHVYRFFNHEDNSMIFHIINLVYDFKLDKVVRAYNISFNFTLPPSATGKGALNIL